MDYAQTLQWMFAQLPMYQQQGASAYKKDLTNTLLLTQYLGHPERDLRFIHVAGTNGKGSTSHMLASVLQQAGYKTGLYTSPHLKDFRERIKINGEMIPEDFVMEFMTAHRPFFEQHELSFFEMSVGMAFDYFNREKVDIAVIEVGLGGRLDSTNVITPLVSVITNIGWDHKQFLGDNLKSIAAEKAGIIKPGIPAVIGEYNDETRPVFELVAGDKNAPLYFASDLIKRDFPSDLKGHYQRHNRKTVLQTIESIKEKGLPVPDEAIADGLLHTVRNTGLRGRWEQIGTRPTVIADTAHNFDGLRAVLAQVLETPHTALHFVLGVVNDKELGEILPLFPTNAHYYFCKPNLPRGLEAQTLADAAATYQLQGKAYPSTQDAYAAARQNAAPSDLIYIGGSTFVVAEIL